MEPTRRRHIELSGSMSEGLSRIACWGGLSRRVAVVAALALVSAVAIDAPSSAQEAVPYPDVAADAYYSVPVAALAADGVFAGTGCDDGFCPGEPIDRATMAVWTVRVLDGLEPVAVGSTRFDDVDASHPHAAFIERLAELGVTTGCRDGTVYCPDDHVTRAQMAVFLSRAYKLAEGPDPGFSDVSAGAWYASDVARLAASGITEGCGDGTGFCPGRPTTRAQMATFLYRADTRTPPSHGGGLFNAVSAGESHACGLRAGRAVECWSYSDLRRADALQGPFSTLSAGALHTCALRTSAAIECWGNNDHGQADAPQGTFSAVSAGLWHSCALSTDSTVECWGNNDDGQAHPPQGTFSAVSAGGFHTCGLRTDDTIECWDSDGDDGRPDPPEGSFSAVSAGGLHTCGLRTSGTIECWGNNDDGQTDAPQGTFSAVSAGQWHSCALRTDDTIECWGYNDLGQADAPQGTFSAVSAGGLHTCGLHTSGTIECWGNDNNAEDGDG